MRISSVKPLHTEEEFGVGTLLLQTPTHFLTLFIFNTAATPPKEQREHQ